MSLAPAGVPTALGYLSLMSLTVGKRYFQDRDHRTSLLSATKRGGGQGEVGAGGVWVGIPVTLWMSGQVRDVAASRLTFFHSLRSFHCHHFKTLFRKKINRCSIALVQLPENSENQQMKLNNLFKLKYINKRIPICLM